MFLFDCVQVIEPTCEIEQAIRPSAVRKALTSKKPLSPLPESNCVQGERSALSLLEPICPELSQKACDQDEMRQIFRASNGVAESGSKLPTPTGIVFRALQVWNLPRLVRSRGLRRSAKVAR